MNLPAPAPVFRLLSRTRLHKLARFASAQVLVQVIGFAAGLLLVRCMAQTDYGHYTLAISMVGLAGVVLDLGLATAVLAVGGALPGGSAIGALVADAFALQRRLIAAGALLLLPAFAAMFVAQGLLPGEVVVLSLLVMVCAGLQVGSQIALAVLRLRGDLVLQQQLEIGTNLGKLVLVATAVLVFIDARIALALNAVAAAAMFVLLRGSLARRLGPPQPACGEHRAALRSFVVRQAPNSLYYCASGQVAVWLVGLFGNADRVAEVGALGRLALLFTLVGAVITALAQPFFARARRQRELRAAFVALNGFFATLTALLVGAALLLPGVLLWILGPRYAGLTGELVWMVLASALAAWSGAVYSLGAARGWVVPSALVIPLGIGTLVLAAALLDMSTVAGSFQLNTASAAMATLLTIAFVAWRLRRLGFEERARGLP